MSALINIYWLLLAQINKEEALSLHSLWFIPLCKAGTSRQEVLPGCCADRCYRSSYKADLCSSRVKRERFCLLTLCSCLLRHRSGVRGRRNPKNLSWTWGHPTRVPFLMTWSCCQMGEKATLSTPKAAEHFHWCHASNDMGSCGRMLHHCLGYKDKKTSWIISLGLIEAATPFARSRCSKARTSGDIKSGPKGMNTKADGLI